jgi:signal transduction histidine kinase
VTAFQLQLERLRRSRDGEISPKQQEILTRMSAAVSRLVDLVESLLHYTRIESGRLTTDIRSFDVRTVASEALEEMRPQAEAKGLNLELVSPSDLPELRSDPQLVRLIVTNLVGNAVKFTEHGKVEVALAATGEGHRIVVRDTGPGIPVEERSRIFEPFERLEPTRKKHSPGIGLGLSLVREMAHALGGRVDLESALGEGSTFTLTLSGTALEADDAHLDHRG